MLRTFCAKRICSVTDFYRNIGYENPHMFEIINGATHALEEKGYSLLLRNMRAADAPALLQDAMLREQADGVLLHATILTKQLAMVLMKADLPYLVIGRPGFSTGVSWMDVNHESAWRRTICSTAATGAWPFCWATRARTPSPRAA